MHDDLDLRVIERHHDADPRYQAALRQHLAAILDGVEALPVDDAVLDDAVVDVAAVDVAAQRPTTGGHRRRWVPGVATLVGAAAAIAAIVVMTTGPESPLTPIDSVPLPLPSTTDPPPSTTDPPEPGGRWPQSTLEEVRVAQERADAGDPDYTWQALPVTSDIRDGIVGRFLREVLGWEDYARNPVESQVTDIPGDATGLFGERYLRCAVGRDNPLPYQPGRSGTATYDDELQGLSCAPTLDDLRYESVELELAQLARQGVGGVWVVNRWNMTAPFAQTDPVAAEATGTARLDAWLAARVAGTGAEGYVGDGAYGSIPLLYAATSGAGYDRYTIERIDGPHWPTAYMTFAVRLFADDATVVEQDVAWNPTNDAMWMSANTTRENGQPVAVPYTSAEGDVTVSAPGPWSMWWAPSEYTPSADPRRYGGGSIAVMTGLMTKDSAPYWESKEYIGFVDPVAYDEWCAANGGTPLLTAAADAAAIAQQVAADPNLTTTAPVAARIGGVEAVSLDVALAPGGKLCQVGIVDISRWVHELAWTSGLRLRLYLVDLPEGSSVKTLAITVLAPEERFEDFLAETAPIIDSIQFSEAVSG